MKKIAILPIKGSIFGEGMFPFLPISPVAETKGYIESITKDAEIRGVIFEINSPGGSPYPCKELARAIERLGKPKVAWIGENGLSGAYWIASSCDEIVADELSWVGGIGVLGIRPDFSELMEKLGIKFDVWASGKFKALGFPLGKKEEGEEFLKEELETINRIFMREVARHRKLNQDQLKELSEGKPYLGARAKELGLVDHLGGREKAIEVCKRLAGLKEAKIIDYGEAIKKKERKNLLQENFPSLRICIKGSIVIVKTFRLAASTGG